MSALWSRQPKRQVPAPVAPPKHGKPNPMFSTSDEAQSFRWRIVGITVGILLLAALGYAVYGPWFAIRTVAVTGTRDIDAASLRQVTLGELQAWRWGIIPQKNLWLLSRRHVSDRLTKKIEERISIESVTIIKKNRHDLEVRVVERSPVAIWTTSAGQATIDTAGVIISPSTSSSELPLLVDDSNRPWVVGQQMLTDPVMAAFRQLQQTLTSIALPVASFHIPLPTCPTEIIQPTNTNQPVATTDENQNTNEGVAEPVEGNENVNEPQVVQTDCDLTALVKSSQEIHIQLKDGPLVLFDRHQDLVLAAQTVKRLIADSANSAVTYIDIRFQERVYVR